MWLETLSIERRYCGPTESGNGGYVCGRIARHIDGPASVRLKIPPPLEVPLQLLRAGDAVQLMHGEQVVGEGRSSSAELPAPVPISSVEAQHAARRYSGFAHHPFPRCFVCGPQRAEHDGLRIFAGPMEGSPPRVAAPWRVDASLCDGDGQVPAHFVWAALDCPSAFAVMPDTPAVAIVLGQLTARVEDRVQPGERCITLAWPIAVEGRKRHAGSAIHGEDGRRIGVAMATWIEVPRSAFPADAAA